MPVAPIAIKSILITSSLVAAGVAAYQTNPEVRNFVDSTKLKAQEALQDFLENLEAEFNPDENARVRLRERRAARARRAREGMMMGVSVDRVNTNTRVGATDIVITASGRSQAQELQDLRHRSQPSIAADDDNDPPEEDITTLASPSLKTTHETLFSQYTSTANLPSVAPASNAHDLAGLTLSPSLTATTSGVDASLDDLNDLDPFADPITHSMHVQSDAAIDDADWDGDDEDDFEDLQRSSHTPNTPSGMSFVADVDAEDPPEEMVLTPVTPMTVPAPYGSYFGMEEATGSRRDSVKTTGSKGSARSGRSSISGVGFETPDDEDDAVTWGRA